MDVRGSIEPLTHRPSMFECLDELAIFDQFDPNRLEAVDSQEKGVLSLEVACPICQVRTSIGMLRDINTECQ